MYSFIERISCIIVAGGFGLVGTSDVITGDFRIKQVPNPPRKIAKPSMVIHSGALLLCGGSATLQKCLQLDHGTWKAHSTLNQNRYEHSAVATKTATFLFGGIYSSRTYEYLPNDSITWLMGKTEIPGGFLSGYAIAVKSDQEIWLIGGLGSVKRILSFNVKDHKFIELPFQLNVGMIGNICAFIPNTKKLMITGFGKFNSAEILDTEDGSITMASPMNSKRFYHGMGVLTLNGEDRLAVFGGKGFDGIGNNWLDTVELYNARTGKWETSDIKLNEPKSGFGFLTVKLSNIILELQCIHN